MPVPTAEVRNAKLLAGACELTGLTYRQIAERAGITSHATVLHMVRGARKGCALTNAQNLARVLDLPFDLLFVIPGRTSQTVRENS